MQSSSTEINRVVLSITPTPGFYEACSDSAVRGTICFIHRLWDLNRNALRSGILVLASHASFDENLTVGWYVALAERLQVDLTSSTCLSGYKDNPDRKIGLVGTFTRPVMTNELVSTIRQQYDGIGELYGLLADEDVPEREVKVLAIMNAFHEDEIVRVVRAAHDQEWTDSAEDGSKVLYLTGAAREYGLEAVAKYNMVACCVGHRVCEEWGVRYLAEQILLKWPGIDVIDVLEEEVIVERQKEKQKPHPHVPAEIALANNET